MKNEVVDVVLKVSAQSDERESGQKTKTIYLNYIIKAIQLTFFMVKLL